MARPTLSSHPKFAKLSARLRGRALARGVLELIWETCYASGEPAVGDAEALEAIADWRGEPGELAQALVQAGFIDLQVDANGDHLHVVHDLEDHAPDYVLKRWEREAKRKAKGLTLREIRQEAARRSWSDRDANVRRLQANVAPPTPAPAPAQDLAPPAPARSTTGAKEWTPWQWRDAYGRAWCNQYQDALSYGDAGDSRACATLADVLERLTPGERISAQGKAQEMFNEFLRRADPRIVQERHPFVFFVQEWGRLRVSKKQAAEDDRCAFHRKGFRGKLPREGAHDTCPECRHARAATGTRGGEPSSMADLTAATDRKLAELRKAAENPATAEQLAGLRAERHPAKAVAG